MQESTSQHYKLRIWLQKAPLTNPIIYMKNMLRYYPKTPFVLNQLTGPLLASDHKQSPQVDWLYKRVHSKYRKSLIRNHHVDIANKRWQNQFISNRVESLCIKVDPMTHNVKRGILEHIIKRNKGLKILKIYWNESYSTELLNCLRYILTLRTLEIHNLPYLSQQQFRRALFTSKNSLESVSIFRADRLKYVDGDQRLSERVKIILELPHLKELVVDVLNYSTFELDKVSGQKLNEIKFSLTLQNVYYSKAIPPKTKRTDLQNVDFLEIKEDFRENWENRSRQWNLVSNERQEAKNRSKRKIFFNRVELTRLVTTGMLISISNVITLDITALRGYGWSILCTPLKKLCNLKNLFLQLHSFTKVNKNLFESLAFVARKYKTLQVISITLSDVTLDENCALIVSFFKACADCVTKVMLYFNRLFATQGKAKYFYEGLSQLKQMKSLNILYEPYNSIHNMTFSNHLLSLKTALKKILNLEELNLSVRNDKQIQEENIIDIFANLKDLQRLTLCLLDVHAPTKQRLLQEMTTLTNLTHLEINVTELDDTWAQIQKVIIINLKKLETLKIRGTAKLDSEVLREKLEALIKSHPSLKFIVAKVLREGFPEEDKAWVFKKGKYWTDIDSFLWDNCNELPQTSNPEVYSF